MQYLNFASRDACWKCNTLKKEESFDFENMCIVCMDNPRELIIKNCGHFGLCLRCAMELTKCPTCMQSFNPDTDLIKVYDM